MESKARLYKTARATVSCAHFHAGELVGLKWSHTLNGVDWYYIDVTEHGPIPQTVAYPAHHLTEFTL